MPFGADGCIIFVSSYTVNIMLSEKITRLKILLIIYLGFISLGLPDTVLGVAWPGMRLDLNAPLSLAGILISLTTVISVLASLAAVRLMHKYHTGLILAACALTTATAMLGYSLAPALAFVVMFTLLFGIGQGAVDTAVNAYMARHYSARHMNWVHGFWGLGATGGPLIFTAAFALGYGWREGYLSLFVIQAALGLIFLRTLKWWTLPVPEKKEDLKKSADLVLTEPKPGRAFFGVFFYFFYPGVEVVTGLWGASYLVETMGLRVVDAGSALTLYWASLTLGRFAMGVAAGKLSNIAIIRAGLSLTSAGVLLANTANSAYNLIAAMGLVGLGLSPLYPSMMHETPKRVKPEQLEKTIGYQVGAALAGAAVIPALIGFILRRTELHYFPPLLLIFTLLMIVSHELSAGPKNKRMDNTQH